MSTMSSARFAALYLLGCAFTASLFWIAFEFHRANQRGASAATEYHVTATVTTPDREPVQVQNFGKEDTIPSRDDLGLGL